MVILEHGQAQARTLLFFPCAAEPVWAFAETIALLSKTWHVFQAVFDGHQPEYADIISGIIIYLCAFSLLFKNLIVTLFTGKHKKQAAKAPDAEKPNGKEAQ